MSIGLFDSGVGGLTVLRELRATFPQVDFVYLGDTARLPYGNKAPDTLRRYTQQNIEFLESQGVNLIVIACHSAASVSLQLEKTPRGTPILNVISPSGRLAQAVTRNKKVAVLATKATVRSQVYPNYFMDLKADLELISQECPLLVPLVEEGLLDDPLTTMALKRYLEPVQMTGADTVILGCTHYPILKAEIGEILGPSVRLIDPAQAVAQDIETHHQPTPGQGLLQVFLTDHAPHFLSHAGSLLGQGAHMTFLFPDSSASPLLRR
jgi:glutamate racemase